MPSRKALCCLVLGAGLLTGCTQWHYDLGTHLYSSDIPKVSDGIGLTQVLDRMGPPQRISASDSGFILAWEHWHIREETLGLSLGALGTDLLSLDWGKLRAKGEFLVLTFDRQHRLTSSALSEWDKSGGGGKAIQPFLSMVSVVDAGDLVGRMPQHRWGAAMLKPMPKALNENSNSNTGQNGLEQRGTPTAIGQQTLEMD